MEHHDLIRPARRVRYQALFNLFWSELDAPWRESGWEGLPDTWCPKHFQGNRDNRLRRDLVWINVTAKEIHHPGDIRLLRFKPPKPKREIGLAWRKTSPRKTDFVQFAQLLLDASLRRGSFNRSDRRFCGI